MKKALAIIIPAFNEEHTIGDVVQRCLSLSLAGVSKWSVFVIDDGSTDRTAEWAKQNGATLVSHRTNKGVGRAFRSGLEAAIESGADLIVNIDADRQFEPEMIPLLIEPILNGEADFVTASRFKDPALVPRMPAVKRWGNRLMSKLISQIAGQRFYDVSCGFRAYSRETVMRLNLWGDFTYTQESILDLAIKNLRIVEIPMKIRGEREIGKSKVASNLWHYGTRALTIIVHAYRDFWPFRFFGFLSLFFLVPGISLIGFLLFHRFYSGNFSPHIWSGFAGGTFVMIGGIFLMAGMVGQIMKRIRLNQETLIYYQRIHHYRDRFERPEE